MVVSVNHQCFHQRLSRIFHQGGGGVDAGDQDQRHELLGLWEDILLSDKSDYCALVAENVLDFTKFVVRVEVLHDRSREERLEVVAPVGEHRHNQDQTEVDKHFLEGDVCRKNGTETLTKYPSVLWVVLVKVADLNPMEEQDKHLTLLKDRHGRALEGTQSDPEHFSVVIESLLRCHKALDECVDSVRYAGLDRHIGKVCVGRAAQDGE